MINQWYGLDLLLDLLDKLDKTINLRYSIRGELIPAWKNFLNNHVDNFNRYPEMVDHGSFHISNITGLLAEWIIPQFKDHDKNKEKFSAEVINAEELFLLLAGIFLHDIGMSYLENKEKLDQELEIDCNLIRKNHGLYSREMLESGKFNELTKGLKEAQIKAIALVCQHHQKKSVIYKKDFVILKNNGLCEINEDTSLSSNKRAEKIKSLETEIDTLQRERVPLADAIKNDAGLSGYLRRKKVDLCLLASILRILDAADIQYSRAGSIWLSKVKKQRNDILKNEKEYILKNIPDGSDNIKKYFRSKIKYFDDQREHYIKHSFFEKSWIIDNQIIFKPIENYQFRELCEIEDSLKVIKYRDQIKKMLGVNKKYIKEELDLVKGHIKNNRPFWKIKSIVAFNRKKHYGKINVLKHFNDYRTIDDYRNNNYIFKKGDVGSRLRDSIIKDLKKPENKVVYVIGPPKTSKTYMLTSVCNEIEDKNIFDGVLIFKLEKENKKSGLKINFVDTFIRNVSSFLADQCDFWFFNRLRTANEVEKSHWHKFFNQLEKGKYLICFDDFNHLPNRNEKAYEYEFLTRMFKRLKKTKLLIFTTQRPINYYDHQNSKEYKMNFDELIDEKVADKFIEDSKNKLSIDKKYIDKLKGFKDSLKKLIIKYHNFPALIFTKFKQESKYYINNGKLDDPAFDHMELINFIEKSIANELHKEIFEKLGADDEKKVIRHLACCADLNNLNIDAGAVAEMLFGKTTTKDNIDSVSKCIESLKLRKLIYQKDGMKGWRIDDWWKAIL